MQPVYAGMPCGSMLSCRPAAVSQPVLPLRFSQNQRATFRSRCLQPTSGRRLRQRTVRFTPAAAQPEQGSEPGVLDKLAGVVKDTVISIAADLVAEPDPADAYKLQPTFGSAVPSQQDLQTAERFAADGTAAAEAEAADDLSQPPAQQQSTVTSAAGSNGAAAAATEPAPSNGTRQQEAEAAAKALLNPEASNATASEPQPPAAASQEWLSPGSKLPDQAPAGMTEADLAAAVSPATPAASIAAEDGQPSATQEPEAAATDNDAADATVADGGGDADAASEPKPPTEEQLDAAVAALPAEQRAEAKAKIKSSWTAKDASGQGGDYLYELGNSSSVNLNVDTAQNRDHIDSLFTGGPKSAFYMGNKSDIADGSLRGYEFRKFDNIQGDYYISPAFLEAVTMHIAKNFMWESLHSSNVPLILGIWGPKGCGKTFQTELVFRKLGVEPIMMDSGEMEHEWAGTPGRMLRQRYRRAAELSKVRGKLSCLVISDIDAGLGHFANTQVTVNNQNVVGTLMNICDNPTRVSIGSTWNEKDIIRRIPIIVTGNDFSTMFAPLIRDGRMEKFYWEPTREDLLEILCQMYKDDNLMTADMEVLLDTFPGQPLDFYGAIRAGTYDGQIRKWIKEDVVKGELDSDDTNMEEFGRRLLRRDGQPVFTSDHITLEALISEGMRLRQEQENVASLRLSKEYLKDTGKFKGSLIGMKG